MAELTRTPVWKKVAPCIYRHQPTGALYERSEIEGRRTFRKLASHKVADARDELAELRAQRGRIERGIERRPDDKSRWAVARVLQIYLDANCPDRQLHRRPPRTELEEKRRVKILMQFFRGQRVFDLSADMCLEYARWRFKRVSQNGADGRRTTDHELSTLANALDFSGISTEPIRDRKKFYQASKARHCRDCAPESGDELHDMVERLLSGNVRTQVLGWQALFEAFTGCRTNEVLRWRMDASKRGEPGFIEDGKWLWLHRSKRGVNPWVVLENRPEMAALMAAHSEWHRINYPASPWYFPSPGNPDRPLRIWALTARLGDMHRVGDLRRKITSHGLRAFYVLVRRSQGIADGQISAEIGDRTIALIENTYGALPANWQGGDAVSFMPRTKAPAWAREAVIPRIIPSKTRIRRGKAERRKLIPLNTDADETLLRNEA